MFRVVNYVSCAHLYRSTLARDVSSPRRLARKSAHWCHTATLHLVQTPVDFSPKSGCVCGKVSLPSHQRPVAFGHEARGFNGQASEVKSQARF